jgi:glutathione S-transferase
MYELFQAEWCPYSSRVRQELTERGVDFVARQVAAEREARHAMRERTGADGIPVLVADDEVFTEFEGILAFLARRHPRRPDARAHRAKAEDSEERRVQAELLRMIP